MEQIAKVEERAAVVMLAVGKSRTLTHRSNKSHCVRSWVVELKVSGGDFFLLWSVRSRTARCRDAICGKAR